jgi:hypothetical protein
MDNMEASFVMYVKVGMFSHLQKNKNTLLIVDIRGKVRLTVHHDIIARVKLRKYPRDSVRQT